MVERDTIKKVIGIVSVLYFAYMMYLKGTIGISTFLTLESILMLGYVVGGASLLFDLPKMLGIVSGVALLVRAYQYSSLILSVGIIFNPMNLIALVIIPLGILYFSLTD